VNNILAIIKFFSKPFQQLMKIYLAVILIIGFALSVGSTTLANEFQQQYDFSIKLYQKRDYYRSISEILKLEFQYPKQTQQSDIKVYLLKNLFYLGQYHELEHQASFTLKTTVEQSENTILEISKILTVSYLKQNNSEAAFQTWSKAFQGDSVINFPHENNIEGLIDPQNAGLSSAILPGSGFLLSENYGKATTSFLLNALFIAGCVSYYHQKNWGITALLLFFEIGWYQGGIRASIEHAKIYNQNIINTYQKKWFNQYTPNIPQP
jgi:hypothetical protein